MQIIAEVKTKSPFGWQSSQSWEELFEIANQVGDIISIHTDPRWDGSYNLLKKARNLTSKPILAKGIHAKDSDISKALGYGANLVLVVGRLPKVHQEFCLIEPDTLEELKNIPVELKAVWNSRDLQTGGLKKDDFSSARKYFDGWLCQASNIHSLQDINPQADAVLIGTHLPGIARQLKQKP
jgi:indole-3-glycerol phosphate synthase